jgi:hypothetical protein
LCLIFFFYFSWVHKITKIMLRLYKYIYLNFKRHKCKLDVELRTVINNIHNVDIL